MDKKLHNFHSVFLLIFMVPTRGIFSVGIANLVHTEKTDLVETKTVLMVALMTSTFCQEEG